MKLALIFPGIGYHADKPLLYYSTRLARNAGFDTRTIQYDPFPDDALGSRERMIACVRQALDAAEAQFGSIDFTQYEKLLFISKSIGTAVASLFADRHGLTPFHFYFTPVDASIPRLQPRGIVFHGTADPLATTDLVAETCREKGLPLHLTGHGNHSLETGQVLDDVRELRHVLELCGHYLKTL